MTTKTVTTAAGGATALILAIATAAAQFQSIAAQRDMARAKMMQARGSAVEAEGRAVNLGNGVDYYDGLWQEELMNRKLLEREVLTATNLTELQDKLRKARR